MREAQDRVSVSIRAREIRDTLHKARAFGQFHGEPS